jgi:transcriptional regulator with XRE-family HTH domain
MDADLLDSELRNPLLSARLDLGFTQFDVADAIGVTRNFVVRAEAGEYPKPPQNLIEYYSQGSNDRAEVLKDAYLAYQHRSRLHAFGLLYPYFESPEDFSVPGLAGTKHPLIHWAYRTVQITPDAVPTYPIPTNLYGICRAFCVHHAIMYRFVHEPELVKSVPKVFLEALFESGYPEAGLIAFEGSYVIYRDLVRSLG